MKTLYSDYQSFRPALHKIVAFEYGDPEASRFKDAKVPDFGTRPEYDPGAKMASGCGVDKRAWFVGWEYAHNNGTDCNCKSLGWLSEDEVARLESVPIWLLKKEDVQSIKAMLKPDRTGYDKMVFWAKYAQLLDNLPDIPANGLENYKIGVENVSY